MPFWKRCSQSSNNYYCYKWLCVIDQHSVKMPGYWPSSFLRGQYPAIFLMTGGDLSWKCGCLHTPVTKLLSNTSKLFCVCRYSFLALLKLWTFFKYVEKFISFLSCCERPYIKLFTLKCCNTVKAVRLTVNHDTALGIWFSACDSFLLPQFGRKLTVVRRLRFTSMNYTNVYH